MFLFEKVFAQIAVLIVGDADISEKSCFGKCCECCMCVNGRCVCVCARVRVCEQALLMVSTGAMCVRVLDN